MARSIAGRVILTVVALLLAALASLVAFAIIQWNLGSPALAERGAALISRQLFADDNTRLRIEDIGGNVVNRLVLRHLAIEVRDGGRWVPWLEIETLRLGYDLRELLEDQHRVRSIHVGGLHVHLPRAYEAKPKFAVGTGGGVASAPITGDVFFQVDDLRVDGAVGPRLAEPFAEFGAVLSVAAGRGFIALDLERSSIRPGDYPEMRATGPLEIRGDTVYLEALSVEGGGSRLVVAGALDGKQNAQLRVDLEHLDLEDVAQATGWQLGKGPSWVRGVADLTGDWSDLSMQLDLEARFGDDAIENLQGRGRLANGTLSISEMSLTLDGVPLAGEGRVAFRRGAESWGRVRFSNVPLKRFPVLRGQSWLPEGTLSGAVLVESRDPDGRPFVLDVDRGVIHGFVLEPGHFEGAILDGNVVRLDSIDVRTRGGVVRGHGVIDPRRGLDLKHEITLTALDAFGAMFGEERLGGGGRLRLAIIGPFASPGFSVSGHLDTLQVGGLELGGVDLAVGPGILQTPISADLELVARGGRAGGRELGELRFSGNVRNDRLRITTLQVAAAGAEFALRGSVAFQDPTLRFRMDHLDAAVGDQHWRTLTPFSGRRRGSVWEIDPVTLGSEAGIVRAGGRFDAGRSAMEVSAEVRRLDLSKLAADWRGGTTTGVVDLDLQLAGRPDSLSVTASLDAKALGTSAFAVDSLRAVWSVDPSGLTIDEVEVARGGLSHVSGRVRFPEPLTPASMRKWLGTRAGWEAADIDLRVATDAVALEAWHGLSATVDRVSGTIACMARLRGSPAAPSGWATVHTERLQVGNEIFHDLDADLELAEGWIELTDLLTEVRRADLGVRGELPVRFSLMRATRLDRDAPIGITLDLVRGDLALASFVTDRVIEARGPVSGKIDITGSLNSPLYDGAIEVAGGTLRLTGREDVLRELRARVVLDGDIVRFDQFEVRSGKKGKARGRGVLYLDAGHTDGFEFDVGFEHFVLRSTGEYFAELSGDLSWSQARGYPKPLPVVDARVKIHRLDYLREVVGGGNGGGAELSTWTGRIEVEAPRNLWIRNQDLEVELKGELTYEREATSRILLGELEVVRGTYQLFGYTFRIREGDILFAEPERIDPDLNIVAETRTPEGRIRIIISGRASDRQVTLDSDNEDLDQATLWAILVPTEGSQMPSLVAMTPFVRDLQQRITQEVPGLSVSLEMSDPETGAAGEVGARVGTYVGSEVFLSGYQGFSSTVDQEVSVEYQLSDLFYVSGAAERRGLREGDSRDIQEEYNINLNFRFEF